MTWIIKHRGDKSKPMLAEYECLHPEHPDCGRFTVLVERDEDGDPPELVSCDVCSGAAEYRISAVVGRVRRIEAVKGRWEPPERKTYLDTRELGEGMDIDEFRAKRAAIWEERRKQDVMAFKKGLL